MTKCQIGELPVPKQRPRNTQTVIGKNEHYDTIIVPETQDSQIPANNKQENSEANDFQVIYPGNYTARVPTTEIRTAPFFHPKIFNLSGILLSKNKIKLTLIPKPNNKLPDIKRKYRRLHKKRGLRGFFADETDSRKNSQDSSDSSVRSKGKLNAPRDRNKILDTIIGFLYKQKFEETNEINKSSI